MDYESHITLGQAAETASDRLFAAVSFTNSNTIERGKLKRVIKKLGWNLEKDKTFAKSGRDNNEVLLVQPRQKAILLWLGNSHTGRRFSIQTPLNQTVVETFGINNNPLTEEEKQIIIRELSALNHVVISFLAT